MGWPSAIGLAKKLTSKRPAASQDADGSGCEALARAALSVGDRRGALTLLMEHYGDAVFRYCRRMVGETPNAEDVHQTVFAQAYRDLKRAPDDYELRYWLFGIARHRCLDALRSQRRRRQRLTQESSPQADESPCPEEAVAHMETVRILELCIARLSPNVRAAVLLRYVSGFSYQGMAKVFLERPATLQARVARALPALRRCIEEQERRRAHLR